MDIDNVLVDIADLIGKEPSYKGTLKRSYNAIYKEKEIEGMKDIVKIEDDFQKIVLLGIGNKYNVSPDDINRLIGRSETVEELLDDDIEELFDDEPEEDGTKFYDSEEEIEEDYKPDSDDDWKTVFKKTKKPSADGSSGEFKKYPRLTLLDNITYKLRLVDPIPDKPRMWSGTSKHGEYTLVFLDVVLIDISDKSLYEEVFSEGDFKGDALFKKGRQHSLALSKERGFPEFVALFRDTLGLPKPDKTAFTLKKSKGKSKKGYQYNIFTFKSGVSRKV